MAITINIYYHGTKDNIRLFLEEMVDSGILSQIREEEGNLRYEYFLPLDDQETVLLIDSWESQEALDKHHDSPLMSRIAKLRNKYNLHMEVERFTKIENNQNDLKFIRK